MLSKAMEELCLEDPHEALRFAGGLTEEDGRCEALIQGLAGIAGAGAAHDALSKAETMIPADDLPLARGQIALKWAESSPGAAMEWAATVSDPAERDSLTESIAAKWAQTHPEAALHWLAKSPDVPAWREVMISVSSEWARSAPDAALAWAEKQSAQSPEGPDLTRVVMQSWCEEDPVSASARLIGDSQAMLREMAAQVTANLMLVNPDLAAEWVGKIRYPDVRKLAEAALLPEGN
jgi:hypothetical protein